MSEPSHALRLFLESFHAPQTDRRYADEFNLAALAQLRPDERALAERLLVERLREDPTDGRVPGALAIVGSKDAVEPLRESLAVAMGHTRVQVAAALAKLDPARDMTGLYTEALRSGDFVTRGLAARLLGGGKPANVRGPLLAALDDDSFGVRIAAFEGLLASHGLKAAWQPPYSSLRAIGMRLLSRLPSVHAAAAGEMRAVIDDLDADGGGDSCGPAELSADAARDVWRVLDSLRPAPPWDQELDLEAIGRLSGRGRWFIECALLSELEHGDPRIPRALAAMRSKAATDPLREAVVSLRGEARVEAARALEILTGDGTGRRVLEGMRDGEHGDAARAALGALADRAR